MVDHKLYVLLEMTELLRQIIYLFYNFLNLTFPHPRQAQSGSLKTLQSVTMINPLKK